MMDKELMLMGRESGCSVGMRWGVVFLKLVGKLKNCLNTKKIQKNGLTLPPQLLLTPAHTSHDADAYNLPSYNPIPP